MCFNGTETVDVKFTEFRAQELGKPVRDSMCRVGGLALNRPPGKSRCLYTRPLHGGGLRNSQDLSSFRIGTDDYALSKKLRGTDWWLRFCQWFTVNPGLWLRTPLDHLGASGAWVLESGPWALATKS